MIKAIVFDVFGTLAEIGDRRRPYARLLRLAAQAGRISRPDDAARIMSINGDIWAIATWLGLALSPALCDELAPYAGAAWEYEFDGKAKATTYGFDVPAPSLKGSTGVGELGLSFTPNVLSQNAFSVDLGLQGYTGMREGLGGSVQMKFEF